MASTGATTSLPNMLSLLSTRIVSSGAPTKRSISLLSHPTSSPTRPPTCRHETATRSSSTVGRLTPFHSQTRHLSKYVLVNHSAAYQNSMNSNHGTQLQLALEEGRGKDDAPFDPFSQFLNMMGNVSEDGRVDEDGLEDIENAEFREIDDVNDDDDDEEDEDYIDNEDDVEGAASAPTPTYTTTGALHRPLSQRLALRAGYPSGGKFAVIHLGGFQHKVTADDLLVVNKLKPITKWSVGSCHTLKDEEVLLVADAERTCVGLPGVRGAEVDVMVEEITRDKTVIVFKKRRRKNSRRKNGFRRQVTFLRVLGVRFPGEEGMKVVEGEEERVAA
ncbi:hypothetical protein HJC23_001777 [Cyclotella cryptica]|uniref:Large ribosomal subunit protein bL21m n=1 Tax=Cyclotella cryptica TaxID=29204 RepID=A0ABD3QPA6_9STRA|eukprot:CCRYP_003340-RA/>CCRYP_003340-RA protein AED:0.13 eAED:0.13 QI:0/-1/0/1/-1/1/1/0/331